MKKKNYIVPVTEIVMLRLSVPITAEDVDVNGSVETQGLDPDGAKETSDIWDTDWFSADEEIEEQPKPFFEE